MVWRHWFIRSSQIKTKVNNEAPVINSSPSAEILAWSLEPRMLFDGAIAATVNETAQAEPAHAEKAPAASEADASHSDAGQSRESATENNSVTPATHSGEKESAAGERAAPAPERARHEVVFIDTSLQDYQSLAAGVAQGVDVVFIDGNKDGLQQMADWAKAHSGYEAIHIFSHGSDGKIMSGSSVLSNSTLSSDTVQAALSTIGQALTRDGDILFYGCDVAASSGGEALIAGIASATGADVAASSDATGSALIGGNWSLEKTVGTVEAHALHVDGYQGLLTEVRFSSADGDLDYSSTSIIRNIDGYAVTFATYEFGFMGADPSLGSEGLYGYDGRVTGNDTSVVISSPTGTTFDITGMSAGAFSGSLHFVLQYGNGTTAAFDLAVNNNGFSTFTSFPSAINDVTKVTITSLDYSAFQSFNITDIKPLSANAAPVVANLNNDSVSFIEGGGAVLLDAGGNATVSDSDSADFGGGNVTVTIAANRSNEDILSVRNQGTGAGQVGLVGSNVTWGGITIGTLSGGSNGNPLVITLNSNATSTAVQGLVRALTFDNSNNADPATATRTLSVTVNDGDGATSSASTVTVNVTGVNDAPALTATAGTPTFTEKGSAVALFSNANVSTIEAGQSIRSLTLTASNLSDGASEILTVDGTSISLTNGASGTTTSGIGYTVSFSGGSALLTLNSATGLSSAATASLINGITYRNSSDNPATTSRVITLSSISDNGGTANGGRDSTALSLSATVSVAAVNDGPTISAPASINVTEDSSTVLNGITITDPDAGNGSVTISLIIDNGSLSFSNGSASKTLNITSTLAGLNSLLASGNLRFTPDANSTANATLTIIVNDQGNTGAGGAKTATTTLTLAMTAVNDAPVNQIPAAQSVDRDGSLIFSTAQGNAIRVSDVDVGSGEMEVTLTGTNGRLTLGSTNGLTLLVGSGINDSVATFRGTLTAINTALEGLKFSPLNGYSGSASLQITTSDLGGTGTGGVQTDTDTIAISVSGGAPTISSVSSTSANGTYRVGDTIAITVTFDSVVVVDTTGGTPGLVLETGATDRSANYIAGSGSNTLTFSYTVQQGDSSADLDYVSAAGLALNGAIISDTGGNAAQLTLFAPGAAGSLGANKAIVVDGTPPVANIAMSDTALSAGDTATVTIAFSEPVMGFTLADMIVQNGTLSNLASSDGGMTWTATFTPNTGVTQMTNAITLDTRGVTDLAGNAGTGIISSVNYAIDTQPPTATIALSDNVLKAGETAQVTIAFNEAVVGLDLADLRASNGTLSNLGSIDGGMTWTANFTPDLNVTAAANAITLDYSGVMDFAGNIGGGVVASGNYAIDTQLPTATITFSDSVLKAGETALVSVTFSEAVTGFGLADLSVSNGTLSNLTTGDGGITWTATFTPAAGMDGTGQVTLNNAGVTDGAGNAGTGITLSPAIALDTQPPTVTGLTLLPATRPQTQTWQLDLSEAVNGLDLNDFTLVTTGDMRATLASLTAISPTRYLIQLTDVTGAGTAQLVLNGASRGITDAAGNVLAGDFGGALYENHAPQTGGIAGRTVAEDSALRFTLPADAFVDSDPGDSLTFTATLADGQPLPAWLHFDAATRTFSGLPGNDQVGALTLQVNATDAHNVTVSTRFTLVVSNTNDAPTATGLDDATVTAGDNVMIRVPSGVFSDVDAGDSLTLSASLASGSPLPAWLRFDAATGTFSGTPGERQVGDVTLRVTATDRAGASVSQQFTLHILASTLPAGDPQFRLDDGHPLADSAQRTGAQSQLALLATPFAPLPLAGAQESMPTLAGLFRDNGNSIGASALAAVFGSGGANHYDPAIARTQPGDITRTESGKTLLASVFGTPQIPGANALEVFSGSSWQHVAADSIAPTVAPVSVFGAPVFSMQLKQLNDDRLEQLASLEGALQNSKPSA